MSKLIEFYEARPLLYDVKHNDYHNRDKRSKALDEISKGLGISGEIKILVNLSSLAVFWFEA